MPSKEFGLSPAPAKDDQLRSRLLQSAAGEQGTRSYNAKPTGAVCRAFRPLGACERIDERRLHLQGADGSVVGLYHVTRTGMCERHVNASFVKSSI